MRHRSWLIYGAYGYTGQLIVAEALRRGHRPVLAGRSPDKLAWMAHETGLDTAVVDLRDEAALTRLLSSFDLVFHAAGPFIRTSGPMVRACLASKTHYVDITGEPPVFERILAQDAVARKAGVVLIPGAGFDVIPSDCLVKHVAARVMEPTRIEIAQASGSKNSPGTMKTILDALPRGFFARRNGRMVSIPMGQGARRVRFIDRERTVIPVPLGDLVTAYCSTGIPDITTYMAFPEQVVGNLGLLLPAARALLGVGWLHRLAERWVSATIHGPDETTRQVARSEFWVEAVNDQGNTAQSWLETMEGYHFTAVAGVRVVEKILSGEVTQGGAFTPAQALGADFVLQLPNTRRLDRID